MSDLNTKLRLTWKEIFVSCNTLQNLYLQKKSFLPTNYPQRTADLTRLRADAALLEQQKTELTKQIDKIKLAIQEAKNLPIVLSVLNVNLAQETKNLAQMETRLRETNEQINQLEPSLQEVDAFNNQCNTLQNMQECVSLIYAHFQNSTLSPLPSISRKRPRIQTASPQPIETNVVKVSKLFQLFYSEKKVYDTVTQKTITIQGNGSVQAQNLPFTDKEYTFFSSTNTPVNILSCMPLIKNLKTGFLRNPGDRPLELSIYTYVTIKKVTEKNRNTCITYEQDGQEVSTQIKSCADILPLSLKEGENYLESDANQKSFRLIRSA